MMNGEGGMGGGYEFGFWNAVAPGEAWGVGIDRLAGEAYLKFANGVQWVRNPPGKGCHPPEASLASVGKSESGSVDSEY